MNEQDLNLGLYISRPTLTTNYITLAVNSSCCYYENMTNVRFSFHGTGLIRWCSGIFVLDLSPLLCPNPVCLPFLCLFLPSLPRPQSLLSHYPHHCSALPWMSDAWETSSCSAHTRLVIALSPCLGFFCSGIMICSAHLFTFLLFSSMVHLFV